MFLESSLVTQPSLTVKTVVWLGALAAATLLATLRWVTEAEFAFMSAVIVPVIAVGWICGAGQGVMFAAAATLLWVISDVAAGRVFSEAWVPVLNGMTRFAVYSLVASLVGTLRTVLLREHELARHDALTGLMNRRAFMQVGADETARARRYHHPIAVIFLDLDNFKKLNDTRGHDVGDLALNAVARTIKQSIRGTDRSARLGGDEFAVLLPETDPAAARETGEKLGEAIIRMLDESYAPVSVSIGVAIFEEVNNDFEQMLKVADRLMYETKTTGKRGVRVCHLA